MWWPLGRPVGSTTHPGLMYTAVAARNVIHNVGKSETAVKALSTAYQFVNENLNIKFNLKNEKEEGEEEEEGEGEEEEEEGEEGEGEEDDDDDWGDGDGDGDDGKSSSISSESSSKSSSKSSTDLSSYMKPDLNDVCVFLPAVYGEFIYYY